MDSPSITSITGYRAVTCMALLAFSSVAGCETLDALAGDAPRPTARLARAQIDDLRLDGMTLLFDVEVGNPYPADLPLVDLQYEVASGGVPLLAGQAAPGGSVPAKGTRTVTVPARLRFADVMNVLAGVRPGALVPYTAEVRLSADAPGLGPVSLPVSTSGELPIPAPPTIRIAGIAWESLTLDRAAARMDLSVTNPNAFAVDLRDLRYALALGGKPVASAGVEEPLSLGDGEEETLSIPLTLRPLDLGLSILSLLRSEGSPYRIDGTVELGTPFGALETPFEHEGDVPFTRR